MTKFKDGDRVTVSGVVTALGNAGAFINLGEHADNVYISNRQENIQLEGTTFRDQAAIAYLAALAPMDVLTHEKEAVAAMNAAEVLDAERKKRDGGALL